MHRSATKDSINDDINFTAVQQNPSSIVILSLADSDIQTLANSLLELPGDFPTIRALNLLKLKQEFVIDDYATRVLAHARVIVLRILGGISYWSYGLEVVKDTVAKSGAALFVLPGDDQKDPLLMSHSNMPQDEVEKLWEYFVEGGKENLLNGLKFLADCCFSKSYNPPRAQIIPKIGIYRSSGITNSVAIIFYRAHFLSGNLAIVDAVVQSLAKHNLSTIAIYVSSLRDRQVQLELLSLLQDTQIILNTTSFALAQLGKEEMSSQLWHELNLPILQVILAGSQEKQWLNNPLGLTPSDLAMNVVLPEVDGRIITRAISFKEPKKWHPQLETEIIMYKPRTDRVDFIADLTLNWLKLKNAATNQRKIALVLANYPPREGRIANGVGLDTPQSCLEILQALSLVGYDLGKLPVSSEDLINQLRNSSIGIEVDQYLKYFHKLPPAVIEAVLLRWGTLKDYCDQISFTGLQFGNVLVAIQPSRGYENDPNLNYHAPDLEPTHQYLAYYYWLRECFGAHAIVHVGKHGNLEWLPGKAVALCEQCYPEIALGPLPHFYPFIVNDPGEGTQAKRRASAVILDHLTPPMTRAELYGDLQKLEFLIDEYYQAELLDPKRIKIISTKIKQLLKTSQIELPTKGSSSFTSFLTSTDSYLCELKESQIRDGLHILGRPPTGTQLRDLIVAIARYPCWQRTGLIGAIALDLGLNFNPLIRDKAEIFDMAHCEFLKDCRIVGDVLTALEDHAQELVAKIMAAEPLSDLGEYTQKEADWIRDTLLPALLKSEQEISNLIAGLDGQYIPAGPSGAPTRGRPDVLPTGRNFFSVDIRSIPTETAWDMGKKAAEMLIERYTQENGSYPTSLAISIWGTATMRNAGEDVAQVLALLGVQPVWDGPSRRVVDFEILQPSVLGRPRVDVTVRISGFFRDSFPTLIQLLDRAIAAVSALEEPDQTNPLADRLKKEILLYRAQGLSQEQAHKMASFRIFGSKPGSYGAGLQGLIEAQNWENEEDLARAYLNWSSYAYSHSSQTDIECNDASIVLPERLKQVQIVLHNQDNREHDLLDSDDYYQFQGGLVVAVRTLTGKTPQIYFGDNSVLGHPRVKSLAEELAKVYRSRVVNPKWLAGMMRHGYKGAFEMAATVDYLFAYDATTGQVPDYMYQGITEAYLLDPKVCSFVKEKNPHALRDIAERLLEAQQRGLWKSPTSETIKQLKNIITQSEEIIEEIAIPKH